MNAGKIVDKLRELKWHIDDDGEKQLREVLAEPLDNAHSVNSYEEMEKVRRISEYEVLDQTRRLLHFAHAATFTAKAALEKALADAQQALDDIERQQEILRDKLRELE